ncbi:MAG: hypothetical protein EBQ70_10390 [Betaproteobacteria bacterium]|nr:hypothetical protein [Betaproteobacteria bacterium]
MNTNRYPSQILIVFAMIAAQMLPLNLWAQRKPLTSNTDVVPVKVGDPEKSTEPRFVDAKHPQAKDLIRLFQEAAKYDASYNVAKNAYLAGKENYWLAFSLLAPQITGTYNTSTTDQRFDPNLGRTDASFSSTSYGVSLTQPLFNWVAYEKFRQGDLLTGVAEANFAQAQQDLIVRVSQAYFDALNSQDSLDLIQNKKFLIKQQLDQAKRNFEVGTATIVDANEAQSRYDLVIAQEIFAQADLVIKKSTLEQIVGTPIDAILPLSKMAKIETVVQIVKLNISIKIKALSRHRNSLRH